MLRSIAARPVEIRTWWSRGGVKWGKPVQPGGCEGSRRWRPWTSSWVRTRPGSTTRGGCSCPARFRAALAGGLVVTTGQEGCLYVFPTAEFHRISALMQGAPGSSRGVRDFVRVFRASAHPDTPDKQGRVTIPAPLRAYAQPRQGVHGHRQRQPARGLGLRRLEHLPRRGHARLLQLLRGLAGGGSGALTPRPAPLHRDPPPTTAPPTDDPTAGLQPTRLPTRLPPRRARIGWGPAAGSTRSHASDHRPAPPPHRPGGPR